MFLRLLVAALVVANLGYFLWARGADADAADREPQRLAQQIRPQLLEIRPPAPQTASAPAPRPAP
jgi:hypothetical protein